MCGISFLLDRTGQLGPEAATQMRDSMAHRGPDGSGAVQFGDGGPQTVYLGHNRLSIIDLSKQAAQPMGSPDGRYALVYNGELYNYRELRAMLVAAGVALQTASDTEVLLHLLIREGEGALTKLRGMFAFVLYDAVTHSVLAARDQAGIKPLFWARTDRGLALASELAGVRASGVVNGAFDPAPLASYLRTRYATTGTFWQRAMALPPGYCLHAQGDAPPTLMAFPAEPPASTSAASLPAIEAALHQSLARHLTADVPVGLWLSGGVDSTLLLALAREAGHDLPCFSIGLRPEEGSFGSEDRRYARQAAHLYEAEYHEFEVGEELLDHLDDALAALGQPIADSSVLLTWWLARQTSREVKAVLSGAGADEWFAGYNRHQAFAWYLRHRHWLAAAAPLLRATGDALASGVEGRWRKRLRLARQFATRLRPTPAQTMAAFAGLDPALADLLQPAASVLEMDGQPAPADLAALLAADRHGYLPNDILALTDQMAMRHGLEVRTPYLDQDLTRLVGALPARELLRHGPKWQLRELLNQRGGQPFTRRGKEGFGLPITRWLRLPKYQALFDPIRRRDHPLFAHFAYDRTQQFLTRFQAGRHDLGAEAWALLTLFRWYDLQVDGGME